MSFDIYRTCFFVTCLFFLVAVPCAACMKNHGLGGPRTIIGCCFFPAPKSQIPTLSRCCPLCCVYKPSVSRMKPSFSQHSTRHGSTSTSSAYVHLLETPHPSPHSPHLRPTADMRRVTFFARHPTFGSHMNSVASSTTFPSKPHPIKELSSKPANAIRILIA